MTETLRKSPGSSSPAAAPPDRLRSSSVRIDVSALTHPGRVRANNEDQFFVSQLTRSLETILTSLPDGAVPERADEINYVMVVADGMGGHAAGEVASRMVISTLVSLALDIPDWFFKVDAGARAGDRGARATGGATGGSRGGRARASGGDPARHGIDADRGAELRPRPARRPRRRLARLSAPRRPAASPDQGSQLCAAAGRHRADDRFRGRPLAHAARPHERARRIR